MFSMMLSIWSAQGSTAWSSGLVSTRYGDLNGDGEVDSTDLTLMKRFVLRIISEFPVTNGEIAGDVSADGTIDSTDLTYLKRYILNIITEFPADKNPIQVPESVIYQAEQATIYKGVQESTNEGFTGSGYVNYDNEVGGYIEWSISAPKYGAYALKFRYANGTTVNRHMEIRVNGNIVNGNLDFSPTGGWTSWNETTIAVNLNSGNNILRATAVASDGGPNVDYVEVSPTTEPVITPTPIPTPTPTIIPTLSPQSGRQMENLDRGVVAVKVSNGVFVSWRMFGTDPTGIAFNVYRNGTKVSSTPITTSTNYVDSGGSTNSTYYVRPVLSGVEQAQSESARVLGQSYMSVPLQVPAGGTTPDGVNYTYSANDCSVGDLDGDGQYEIVLKWDPSNAKDNSQSGYTGNVYLDAYKFNGTRLWRIDLGRNIRAGAHYTQFMVYDLDGDGRAEVACKTADGTVDGKGAVIGSASADYRNSGGYILSGPEYLTIFDGRNGAALSTVNYEPPRGNVSSWGDNYGNRVDRFLACIAYLDGKRPSLVMARGYYTRSVLVAYNWRDGELSKVWTFDSNSSGNSGYAGMGNHNLSVGDVDSDGKDEIIYGACAIDDNGRGLYTTGLGHGDAMHLSDMDPDRPGLEVWQCHEWKPSDAGSEYRDARTGRLIFGIPSTSDVGRAMAADIDPRHKGYEMWTSASGGVYNNKGSIITSSRPSMNFGIWWDGDLLRELLDGTKLDKWNYNSSSMERVFTIYQQGVDSINGTKANPNLSADILGDWREEMIFRTIDSKELRIFTTTIPTNHRIYTLMHDPQYRLSVAWQNVAYNQPPHPGFYLGEGMAQPPRPGIYLVP